MKNRKVYVTTFCGVAVAMNIVLGIITSALGIPLYLDTLGTVLSAAILGPVPGIIVGALSNIITGLIYSVSDIPFCLVNMAVGLIVGLVAKKWKFGIVPAVITSRLQKIDIRLFTANVSVVLWNRNIRTVIVGTDRAARQHCGANRRC